DSDVLQKAKISTGPLIEGKNHSLSFLKENFLTETSLYHENRKFNLIVGNPPYNATYTPKEWIKIKNSLENKSSLSLPKESSFFFVLKSLRLLKPDGILAFILPKPFVCSNRWKVFREICFKKYRILEIFDLLNQFSGQLQEQIVIIIQNKIPAQKYSTGIWNKEKEKLIISSKIDISLAISVDNFLIEVKESEQEVVKNIQKRSKRISWEAFRGLSSQFRSNIAGVPLIEKTTIAAGFLLPHRYTVEMINSSPLIKRIQRPKLISQRIISYQTKPKYKLTIPVIVDIEGSIITHETAINIIPPTSDIVELYSYGALLQSTFASWWFQHVVYTKMFVTSKDLDKPYINKFVIPIIGGMKNKSFRSKMQENNNPDFDYSGFLDIIQFQSKTDMFYSIGKLFQKYLFLGKQIRENLDQYFPSDLKENSKPSQEYSKIIKSLNISFVNRDMKKLTNLIEEQHVTLEENSLTKTLYLYENLEKIRNIIDEVVYLLYDLSPIEKNIVQNSRLS
ncbi:MAG: Eco57I restriction-modification methylase domain-containing protein, partial [Candidatus Hodarchaeales archaeon]